MFDIDRPDQRVHTTGRLVRSCEAAEARLGPLIAVIATLARSRPDGGVSDDLLTLARQALGPARRITQSLGMAPLPPLHEPMTHAALAARLGLAAEHAARFRDRYFRYDPQARAKVWQVHHWRVHAMGERLAIDQLEGRIPDHE
jgi:hypothetical protein